MLPSVVSNSRISISRSLKNSTKRAPLTLSAYALLLWRPRIPLFRGKRRINIDKSHTGSAVGAAQFASPALVKERFHRLQVVTKDQAIVPIDIV